MTEELKEFCDRLNKILNILKHRDELKLECINSEYGKGIFKHEISIEKLHNEDLPKTFPFLDISHKVLETTTGRRILIETYSFAEESLMINTSYYYGTFMDGSFGIDMNEMEYVNRLRMCDEDSLVDFEDLCDQLDLATVKFL